MKKSIALLNKGFESSSGLTPEFKKFFTTFKKEITDALLLMHCTDIKLNRGHFYPSGFFTTPSGQPYYFSMPDVRMWDETGRSDHFSSLLYRTAKDYKDYSGGQNQYVKLDMLSNLNLQDK